MAVRECTESEGAEWAARFGDGASAARGDVRSGRPARDGAVIIVPAEFTGETGAQYVARWLPLAWRIGYTGAWRWAEDHGQV